MKEHPIIFSTDMVKAILEGRKTQTRRIVIKQNSVIGEGGDWNNLDFYAQTYLSDRLKQIMAIEAKEESLADSVVKQNGKAPMPWVDNSLSPQYRIDHTEQYLHVPYNWQEDGTIYRVYCRYDVGDRLWVRQSFAFRNDHQQVMTKAEYELICDKLELESFAKEYLGRDMPNIKWTPAIFMPRKWSFLILEITGIRVERVQDITYDNAFAEGMEHSMIMHNPVEDLFVPLWDNINAKRGYSWEINPWVWVIEFRRI